MDTRSLGIGVLIGIITGFIIAGIFVIYGASEVGNSIHVTSMNVTMAFPLNETQMIEAINRSR